MQNWTQFMEFPTQMLISATNGTFFEQIDKKISVFFYFLLWVNLGEKTKQKPEITTK